MWFILFCLIVGSVYCRTCNTVNGVSGACNMELNHFTLAGSHNSGAGSFGGMYYWSGFPVLPCFYHNQDKSIREQLELGIRYFDFDLAYIEASEAGGWWEEGAILVHSDGYSRNLKYALLEIDAFLGRKPDELVVIRLKDHAEWARSLIAKNLDKELAYFYNGLSKTKLSQSRNPRLGDAITNNERLVVFINGGFGHHKNTHSLAQIESYNNNGGTAYCYTVDEVANKLLSDQRIKSDYYAVEVDWFHSYGLCNYELSGLCDEDAFYKIETINKRIISSAGRPINLIMVDYVGRGNVRLSSIVQNINKFNVQKFG